MNGWVNGFWQSFSTSNLPELQETPSTEAQKPTEQPEKKDENVSEPSSFISAAKTGVIVSMVNAQKDKNTSSHIIKIFGRMSFFCFFGRMFRVNPPVVPAKLRRRSVAAQGDQRKTHPKRLRDVAAARGEGSVFLPEAIDWFSACVIDYVFLAGLIEDASLDGFHQGLFPALPFTCAGAIVFKSARTAGARAEGQGAER